MEEYKVIANEGAPRALATDDNNPQRVPNYSIQPAEATITEAPSEAQPLAEDWVTLSEVEGRYVARVLEHTGGNKQAAARVLAVDRKTLDRMIKRHHIEFHRKPQKGT